MSDTPPLLFEVELDEGRGKFFIAAQDAYECLLYVEEYWKGAAVTELKELGNVVGRVFTEQNEKGTN